MSPKLPSGRPWPQSCFFAPRSTGPSGLNALLPGTQVVEQARSADVVAILPNAPDHASSVTLDQAAFEGQLTNESHTGLPQGASNNEIPPDSMPTTPAIPPEKDDVQEASPDHIADYEIDVGRAIRRGKARLDHCPRCTCEIRPFAFA